MEYFKRNARILSKLQSSNGVIRDLNRKTIEKSRNSSMPNSPFISALPKDFLSEKASKKRYSVREIELDLGQIGKKHQRKSFTATRSCRTRPSSAGTRESFMRSKVFQGRDRNISQFYITGTRIF